MAGSGVPVRGIVVAHADVGEALVRAVERIAGVRGALESLSNQEHTPEEMERRIVRCVEAGPTVVFVDFATGSCAHLGRRVASRVGATAVVTGVNLPMLLDFVFHREMALEELAERVLRKGREGTSVDLFPAPSPQREDDGDSSAAG